MSELLTAQIRFAEMLPSLLIYAKAQGYQVTLGEASRSDEQAEINALGHEGRTGLANMISPAFPQLALKICNNGKAGGIRESLHEKRLAIDLHLFKDGVYLSKTEDHLPLGLYWESIGGTWGGRFNDGNHYSLAFGGKK